MKVLHEPRPPCCPVAAKGGASWAITSGCTARSGSGSLTFGAPSLNSLAWSARRLWRCSTLASLGPPLVVTLESVLRQPDDPREALDFSYDAQLEILQQVRRGVADVATSRYRVELQARQLEQSAAKLAAQRQDAADSGNEELARQARARESGIQEQLSDLRPQLSVLENEEERLTAASQRLQAKVDAFRTRKETIKARYTAAEATWRVREAFASIGDDASDLESVPRRGLQPGERSAGQRATRSDPGPRADCPDVPGARARRRHPAGHDGAATGCTRQ